MIALMQPSGSASDPHSNHGQAPCAACQEQSMGSLPWLVVALGALLVIERLRRRWKRRRAAE